MDYSKSASAFLDRLGDGAYQRRLLFIAGAGFAFDAMEIFTISLVLPVISKAWGLGTADAGYLASASLFGMFFGSLAWGYVSDRLGRKISFELTVAMYSLFALLCAFSPDYLVLFAFRFLAGVGLGGCLAVDTALLSESASTKNRGRHVVLLDAFWPFGQIIAVALAFLFLPDWRLLFAVSAFPAILVALIRLFAIESPLYLAR